jgi:cytochrome c oxidase subunit II
MLLAAGVLLALVILAAACAPNATQDSLKPAGPNAETIDDLFRPVFWIAVGVFVVVEGMLVYLTVRYRHRKGRREIPPQVHGNQRLEIAWTIVPAIILVGVAIPTISGIYTLAAKPSGRVLEVNVIGHQWWWEFTYPGLDVTTANVLHIPVGEPVYASLCAAGAGYEEQPAPSGCLKTATNVGDSVIHSFWVPQLAGKQDVVPGRTNHLVLEADRPGTYTGQCAEFCGLSHADMRLKVIAQPRDEFDAWVRAQQADAPTPADGSLAATGLELFNGQCIACHAVQGNPQAVNIGGPNLTHLMSRDCFAGCIFEVNAANLATWLRDPSAVKGGVPGGASMPDYNLTDEQIRALVAYLMTLE